jgi:CDP-diacylglycerol--serine O-phosphatidyltransferase
VAGERLVPGERVPGDHVPGDRSEEEKPKRQQPSRGMYLLPSLFTAGNIAAGYYAITQSVQGSAADHGYFDRAALAIGAAALLDGVDGFVARLTRTTSDFGRELDSLADVITFGVAPSLLAYIWGFRMLPVTVLHGTLRENVVHAGVFVCFLFLICGASRLARFNISVNPQPRNADTRWGRGDRRSGALLPRFADLRSSDGAGMAGTDRVHRLPDGEQLAILEREGDYFGGKTSVPGVRADCSAGSFDCVELGADVDGDCAGLSGFGRSGATGLFVESTVCVLMD